MPSDATEAALGLLGLTAGSPMDTLPTVPSKRKQPSAVSFDPDPVSDTIDCICGFHYDDGFSIGCDACSRWCHAACFGIAESEVPEEWHCWVCRPRPVDKERAIKVQKTRQKAATALALQQKPRTSPGVERKPRRVSAAAIDGGSHNKRKRRSSINAQHPNEDEHVDIDEPWTHSYVPIEKDIVPHDDTRDRLRRVAAHWRGITALHSPPGTPSITPSVLAPDTDPSSSQINLQPLSPASSHPPLSSHVNPSVRPPAYAVHATHSIPSSGLVAPYPSTIIPSAAYLSDPLNAYAHLGMPKPFVHLFGPPLDVALDARITGGQSRFVRSGCRPNTVLRPVLCPRSRANSKSPPGGEDTLTFGIFALRDLKAHEEVVLGWEWDDGSVVHNLPALLESPDMFPAHELQHMRYKMTSLLHTLSSTFTTCACGAQAQDCALTRMAEFVEGQTPPTPAPSPPSGVQAGNEARESEKDRKKTRGHVGKADLGPLVGAKRGFRTRERERMSGGMSGMEMDPSGEAGPSSVAFNDAQTTTDGKRSMRKTSSRKAASQPEDARSPTAMKDHKGKGRADALESPTDQQTPVDDETTPRANRSRRFRDQSTASPTERRSRSPIEDKMPPKMRKHFIHRSLEALRNTAMSDQRSIRRTVSSGDKTGDRMDVDESTVFDAAASAAIVSQPTT
ncbi:hypothetical protein B0H21DRAFT_707446 [Amylocystis lapponica]|nr:hypothetical protein B0H21DRAFT_707446 [Amylocystis lapponica]